MAWPVDGQLNAKLADLELGLAHGPPRRRTKGRGGRGNLSAYDEAGGDLGGDLGGTEGEVFHRGFLKNWLAPEVCVCEW